MATKFLRSEYRHRTAVCIETCKVEVEVKAALKQVASEPDHVIILKGTLLLLP